MWYTYPMSGLTTRLEEMCLKGELFNYCLSKKVAMNLLFNFVYNSTGIHTQYNTIFNRNIEKWILENIDKVYMNADYHNDEDGFYDDMCSIVVLYFSSREDLMAFKLRWE